jgi:hypothetical protein
VHGRDEKFVQLSGRKTRKKKTTWKKQMQTGGQNQNRSQENSETFRAGTKMGFPNIQ